MIRTSTKTRSTTTSAARLVTRVKMRNENPMRGSATASLSAGEYRTTRRVNRSWRNATAPAFITIRKPQADGETPYESTAAIGSAVSNPKYTM